jgi:hypothetical protein
MVKETCVTVDGTVMLNPTLGVIVNERPLAVSLGLGAICQGPRSTWCSEKSSDQNSALENVIDWLKSAIHISA